MNRKWRNKRFHQRKKKYKWDNKNNMLRIKKSIILRKASYFEMDIRKSL